MRSVHLGPSLSATYSVPKAVPSLLSPSDLRWTLSCASPWTPYLAVSDLTSSPFLAPMSPAKVALGILHAICAPPGLPLPGPHPPSAWKVFSRLTLAFMELSLDYFLVPLLSGPQAPWCQLPSFTPFLPPPHAHCRLSLPCGSVPKAESHKSKLQAHLFHVPENFKSPVSTATVTTSA